jgi:ATP-binding cassette subfamily C (CFTR/MRP) protein 1
MTTPLKNYMNAVERTVHYTRDDLIDQEPPHHLEKAKPPQDWPSQGAIDFVDVEMSYRPGLPSVLNGINLSILPGEKVGVVGRTGAGKVCRTDFQALSIFTDR